MDAIFQEETLYVSEISRLEVLGYHKIGDLKGLFEQLFAEFNLIPISEAIINRAILIRQQKSMSLGDAIIAASALHNDLTLVSRNVKDFDWLENLTVHNPFNDR